MILIAFTGLKGSGKDTAALAYRGQGYAHVKMADGLKGMLRAMLSYQGVEPEVITRMLEGDLKEEPTAFLAGRSPRHAMITLGTEWGRDLMSGSLWVDIATARCRLFPAVVISDIRFPNEVDMVHRLGGKVYRIERGITDVDPHPSESQILTLAVDGVIANDFPTAATFVRHVQGMIAA